MNLKYCGCVGRGWVDSRILDKGSSGVHDDNVIEVLNDVVSLVEDWRCRNQNRKWHKLNCIRTAERVCPITCSIVHLHQTLVIYFLLECSPQEKAEDIAQDDARLSARSLALDRREDEINSLSEDWGN